MFEYGRVNFVGEVRKSTSLRALVLSISYTIDGEKKEVPFLVYENGNYKTSIEDLFSMYVSRNVGSKNGVSKGMSKSDRDRYLDHIKTMVNKWCRDLGYPKLKINTYQYTNDSHLL